jgi:hypothetical protein
MKLQYKINQIRLKIIILVLGIVLISGINVICDPGLNENSIEEGTSQSNTSESLQEVATTFSKRKALPKEVVDVTCDVFDQEGNIIMDIGTYIIVEAADGSTLSENGIMTTGKTVSATRAKNYYVACAVSEFDLVDYTPDVLTVNPGLPHHWSVNLAAVTCHDPSEALPLSIDVFDAWDNEIGRPDYSLLFSSEPVGAVLDNDNYVRVSEEGNYKLIIELTSTQAPDSLITPFVTNAQFDISPPEINFVEPIRGSMIQQGGTAEDIVTVAGVANDTSDILDLIVVGQDQMVSGNNSNENFSIEIISRWGHSIITASATDSCGYVKDAEIAYLRSGQYRAPVTWPFASARLFNGVIGQMNQTVLDDKELSDADDLATLVLTEGLELLNLNSVIPVSFADTLTWECHLCGVFPMEYDDCEWDGYQITKNGSVTWDGPSITTFEAVDGGITMNVVYMNVVAPLFVEAWYNCACCDEFHGSNAGELYYEEIMAVVSLSVTNSGYNAYVSICQECITLQSTGPFITIDWSVFDFLSELTINSMRDEIVNNTVPLIEDAIIYQVRQEIPPIVEEFFDGFSLVNQISQSQPMSIDLYLNNDLSHLALIGPAGSGYANLRRQTQIYPPSRDELIPATALGSIAKDSVLPTFSSATYEFAFGLEDNLINQLFWAIWYGGGFIIPEISQLMNDAGLPGVTGSLETLLPPVLMPPTGNGDIDIGVGDIFIDATVDPALALGSSTSETVNIKLYAAANFDGKFEIDEIQGKLSLIASSTAPFTIQIVQCDNPEYTIPLTEAFATALNNIWVKILDDAVRAFSFPTINIGGITGVPNHLQLRN